MDKQEKLEELSKELHEQQEAYKEYKAEQELLLFRQQQKINQEQALIETDNKLLFEKLD
jgi:hypothetical protein